MKKMIGLFLLLACLACDDETPMSDIGCVYAYPSDGDPYAVIGCVTPDEFDQMEVPGGYEELKWIPIPDCSECERRDTRGADRD